MSTFTEQFGVQYDSVLEQSGVIAKQLHDAKWIYGLYGALDGLSTSFSMLKYFFDMYYTSIGASSSSSDKLHDWSLTTSGIAILTIESAVLIVCSVIGNMLDEDGYYLHFMSVDEAKELKHVNCYVWDGIQLVYISPDGSETVFNRHGDVISLDKIKKLKAKTDATTRSLHLSVKQADGLIKSTSAPFDRASPTLTLAGSIVAGQPYARDVMKAMKNTYKGLRNTFVLTDLLVVGRDYHYMVVPGGIVLGILAACNRTWLRSIRDERKDAKKLNIELLASLNDSIQKKNATLTLSEWDLLQSIMKKEHEDINSKIQPPSHSQLFWLYAQLSGAFSGLVDSPYLYFGALSLTAAAVTSAFFILVATSAFIFAAVCIATRVYEEQTFQRELLVSQLEVELAMSIQEIRLLRGKMRAINDALFAENISTEDSSNLRIKQSTLILELDTKWVECQLIHNEYIKQATFSLTAIIMSGLKNGLDTYGALASLMFLIATINMVLLVPFSQVMVMSFVIAGLTGLVLFPVLALLGHFYPQENQAVDTPSEQKKKKSTLEHFSDLACDIEGAAFTTSNPATPVHLDNVLEVGRGACSGMGKAVRAVEQVLAVSQELGADGHYHDTDSMLIIALINGVLFGLTWALRQIARIGRSVPIADKPAVDSSGPVETTSEVVDDRTLDNIRNVSEEQISMSANSSSSLNGLNLQPPPSPGLIGTVTHTLSDQQIAEQNYLARLKLFKPSAKQILPQNDTCTVFENSTSRDSESPATEIKSYSPSDFF